MESVYRVPHAVQDIHDQLSGTSEIVWSRYHLGIYDFANEKGIQNGYLDITSFVLLCCASDEKYNDARAT